MYTGAQVIIQAGQDLPARWGAAITCVSTQCPATLQDHRYLQLHFTWWWGGLSTHETAKIQPHIHPRISRLVLAPTRGNPRAQSFRPHTPQASLYITPDIKTKQGKSAWTGVHTSSWPLPVPVHAIVSLRLNFLGPTSRVISCSKVNAVSHAAMSTRLFPTASKCQKVAQSFSYPVNTKL